MDWIIVGVIPACYLKLFWSMRCPEILLLRNLCNGISFASFQEWRNVWHIRIFPCHYATSPCAWLTSGSYMGHTRIVSQSVGQQEWPIFNPYTYIAIYLIYIATQWRQHSCQCNFINLLYQLSFYLIQLHSYIFKYNSMVAESRSVVYGGSTVV